MRLIDADFIESLGATCIARRNEDGTLCPISAISMIPTVDAVPKARWKITSTLNATRGYWAECSNCKEIIFGGGLYCSNCGAKMDAKEDEP